MKKTILLCVITLVIFLSGCGGKEIDSLAMVVGTAFDKSDENIEMTSCLLKANGKFGAESGEDDPTMIVSSEGKTVLECQSNLTKKTEREPFFGHNNIVVLSSETDMEDILFSFYEQTEKRGAEKVIITKNDARKAMEAENFMGPISSISLDEILSISKKNSNIYPVRVHDIISSSYKKSSAVLVPFGKSEDKNFIIDTMCVLKDFKLLGTLGDDELLGANILLQKDISSHFCVNVNKSIMDAQIYKIDTDIKYKDGSFYITPSCYISVNDIRKKHSESEIKQSIKEYIEAAIFSAISKSISLDADFLGFLDKYYNLTEKSDKVLSDFNFYVKADITLIGEEQK